MAPWTAVTSAPGPLGPVAPASRARSRPRGLNRGGRVTPARAGDEAPGVNDEIPADQKAHRADDSERARAPDMDVAITVGTTD